MLSTDNDRLRVALLGRALQVAQATRLPADLDRAIDGLAELVGSLGQVDAWQVVHDHVDDVGGDAAVAAAWASGDWAEAVAALGPPPPDVAAALTVLGLRP